LHSSLVEKEENVLLVGLRIPYDVFDIPSGCLVLLRFLANAGPSPEWPILAQSAFSELPFAPLHLLLYTAAMLLQFLQV
jgi:hypothetical protein